MANRAFKRDIATLQNELVLISGRVIFTPRADGIAQTDITTVGFKGLIPQVLSGSSPSQFTSQYPVVRNISGSYILKLADSYPQLLASSFELCASGSVIANFDTRRDTGVPLSASAAGTGVTQVGFALYNTSSLADPTTAAPFEVDVILFLANSTV